MPNVIKYNTSFQSLALKSGNYWIGTGDVDKGPTSTTDYWNGITPPAGGYTIYLNKASNGPSIYVPANDTDLIYITNTVANSSFTSATQCFNYFRSQTDKMVFNIDYENIITNGLVLCYDAGFRPSYTTSGTVWTDLSFTGNTGTLTNGPTYDSGSGGSIVFDGTDDYVIVTNENVSNRFGTGPFTLSTWAKTSNNNVFGYLMGKRNPAGNTPIFGYAFGSFTASGTDPVNTASKKISFVMRNSSTNQYVGTSVNDIVDGGWKNIVFSRDSLGVVKLYSNGVSQSFTTIFDSGTGSASNISIVGINYAIGALRDTGGSSGNLNGNIAIAQMYNRGLTDSEVLQNYNAQKSRFGL